MLRAHVSVKDALPHAMPARLGTFLHASRRWQASSLEPSDLRDEGEVFELKLAVHVAYCGSGTGAARRGEIGMPELGRACIGMRQYGQRAVGGLPAAPVFVLD